MKAIVSDIHGNLEALQAVLHDIDRHPVERIYCLGDLVGYGPNPRECIDLAMAWQVVLRGNFEQAVVAGNTEGFGVYAGRSVLWTQQQLQAPASDQRANECRRDFLASLPHLHRQDSDLFVHGSPRNPLHEYVFPEDIANEPTMTALFALLDRYCFTGHTHHPGIFTEDGRFLRPEEFNYAYRLDGQKTLCNVGSVGQPRDGDWRACYVLLLDGELVRYRRVEYDVQATIKKIRDNECLDDFLGERLKDGR